MRVVALISGGKDSCYNMLQCVAAGHDIVALANLRPVDKDELDSFMYQTVGHQGVELYAEALGIPLFRQSTQGVAILQDKSYTPTPKDEVEDLYQLLKNVKEELNVDGVAVGAILSDYQRIRVENVCARLGLVALAYLWRRDQAELLQEMIDCGVVAIVVKVAALGLEPGRHLGLGLADLRPHILLMKEKYGLNVCGEGGEYETFTLDCPLFLKKIVIDEVETVIHSNDAIAPVGYLNFKKMHLVCKNGVASPMSARIEGVPVRTWQDLTSDLREQEEEEASREPAEERDCPCGREEPRRGTALPGGPAARHNASGWSWLAGVVGEGPDCGAATRDALHKLHLLCAREGLAPRRLVAVALYVSDLAQWPAINAEYAGALGGPEPPARVCAELPLPARTPVALDALSFAPPCQAGEGEEGAVACERRAMHVQGVSHWAPASIGPYSQAVQVGDIIYVAGQIALVPGTMCLVEGGVKEQCRLALRHIGRIVSAMDPSTQLRDVVHGICYVTLCGDVAAARREWERQTNNAIVDYVVVSKLPRDALVEWHVWAHRHNSTFDYEETGCCIDDYRVSIRRRWNYEHTVSAVVCHVSTGSGPEGGAGMTDDQLSQVLCYALGKLLRKAPPATACHLRVFCRAGAAVGPERVHAVLARAEGFNIAHTVLPVRCLPRPRAFLSVCGVRHE
ncbi:uncharacterized protein LOC134535177 [Bacillus rossius redtenbacheri]|uniref:uncharacterized protein LOC134535177 n=1 Tax=Bacillus rossius redtenbacheri TaxID=93214 RepID=UPI002FDE82F3